MLDRPTPDPSPKTAAANAGQAGAIVDHRDAAESVGLRYASTDAPGFSRRRSGKGFSYRRPDGSLVKDPAVLRRIRALVVPPAWRSVWICPDSEGHVQAIGIDERGRRQYRYHPKFRAVREGVKFEHMMAFADALPTLRRRIAVDMAKPGLNREKVLATVVHLLETTMIRVGNAAYARDNKSYGLTTLLARHVTVDGAQLRFHFKGKSGKTWRLNVKDRRIARIVKSCQDIPGQHLFQYLDGQGERQSVTSSDVNAYLKQITGADITAKDFRTWTGTVLAAMALVEFEAADGKVRAKKNVTQAIERVAARLGNTPTICRKCYVHPEIVNAYLDGDLLLDVRASIDQELREALDQLRPEETAVLAFLRTRVARALAEAPQIHCGSSVDGASITRLKRCRPMSVAKKSSPKPPKPKDRAEQLLERQRMKMAREPQTYVRGSTASFYDWLAAADHQLPQGPTIWICGDCHYGNLGPVANAKDEVAIQIRDLDQTVIGNPAHDVIRLALSLASAARGFNLPGVTTAQMVEQIVDGYQQALTAPSAPDEDKPPLVQGMIRASKRRRWTHLARERIEDVSPAIPLGKRFWPLSKAESGALEGLVASEPIRDLVTQLSRRSSDAEVDLVDAAYWVKGCSSLGLMRYAVLARVGSGKAKEYCLIDVKEAVKPAAPRAKGGAMPKDNGARVVEGARRLSPHLGDRMRSAHLLDRSVFVRELRPQDMKLEIETLKPREAVTVARFLAGVVGRSHGRQLDQADRQRWADELDRNRSKSLDAPSWLWKSVIDQMAQHEQAYLDHCRQHARVAA